MKRIVPTFFLTAALTCSFANAQVYQWKDKQGNTVYSDTPPLGQVEQNKPNKPNYGEPENTQEAQKQPAPETPQITPAQSNADKEIAFRKRQQEAAEKTEKEEKESTEAARKKDQCNRARRYLQALESGERIATRNDKGEKAYMDDTTRQQEIEKTKTNMQSCEE